MALATAMVASQPMAAAIRAGTGRRTRRRITDTAGPTKIQVSPIRSGMPIPARRTLVRARLTPVQARRMLAPVRHTAMLARRIVLPAPFMAIRARHTLTTPPTATRARLTRPAPPTATMAGPMLRARHMAIRVRHIAVPASRRTVLAAPTPTPNTMAAGTTPTPGITHPHRRTVLPHIPNLRSRRSRREERQPDIRMSMEAIERRQVTAALAITPTRRPGSYMGRPGR